MLIMVTIIDKSRIIMYKDGGSYESPSLYMGHVVERCADRSIGRLLQILYVVHVVLIPAFFL